jgi:anaerobic magnesium-protoporphyrin IX monomethyl ester cyclase
MSPSQQHDLRIVLLQPSRQESVECLFTFHKNEAIGHRPPLGILTLATYLIEQGFRNTGCLDARLDDLSPEQTADRVAESRPDLVGVSAWTDFWYPTWKTIKLIKERLPACRIVVGGPHCLVYPRETLEHSDADYLVAGDGEDTLLGLVRCLQENRPIDDLPGLWRKDTCGIIAPTTPIAVVDNLDKLPILDRTLLPYRRYNSVLNPNEYETTMISSRGCPNRCVFCKMHAQKVYASSAERFVEEFRQIEALGISDIQVYDDTFTWSKQRVIDICHGILDAGIQVRWAIRDRVNKADAESYALLRKAGCYRIHFGVESGSPPILKASGKNITLDQAEDALSLAKRAGFTTMAFYMFGFLDETYEDALATIRFATRTNSDYATFSVLIPYPGTALYEAALERGVIPSDFWLEFTRNPVPNYRIPHLIEQYMDRATLIRVKDKALRRYYFRPARLARELAQLRSWTEFKRKASMGMNIVTDSLESLVRGRPSPTHA